MSLIINDFFTISFCIKKKEVLRMKKFKEMAKKFVVKYGAAIAACAFAIVTVSANSSCCFPYYEPEEPAGLSRFKKTDR